MIYLFSSGFITNLETIIKLFNLSGIIKLHEFYLLAKDCENQL